MIIDLFMRYTFLELIVTLWLSTDV